MPLFIDIIAILDGTSKCQPLRLASFSNSLKPTHQSAGAIGYKEMFAYQAGECGLEEIKDLIKQHSRNYAKRQLTWFRKNPALKDFCNI